MKPEDLKFPFSSWANGHVLIQDHVWYVPETAENAASFVFPGWENDLVFGNQQPVFFEYCSGNGAWVAAKAKAYPQINWVALEMKFGRVRKLWSKIKNLQLKNLFVICGEALHVTKSYLAAATVSQVFINFPDPWPKRRHSKNRLIAPHFLQELHLLLNSQGSVTFVTDDASYSQLTIKEFTKHAGFVSHYLEPYYVHANEEYGTSYFEDLWRSKGKSIYYHQFNKRHED